MRVLAGALLLAGCGAEQASEPDPAAAAVEMVTAPHRPACDARVFEGTNFTVCPVDTRRDRLELVVDGPDGAPLRSLAALEQALGPRAQTVRFAMNAGMYDEAGRPIGLYVENGDERRPLNLRQGPGNFHLLPNAVFAVDGEGRVSVTESRSFRARVPSPRLATQSGPMLVIDGKLHPAFDQDGESRLVRNGVGVRDGRTAYFVISEDPVSFGRFARLFRDALKCRNALFLDGSVSSLWDAHAGRQDGYSQLGPMIVVSRPST